MLLERHLPAQLVRDAQRALEPWSGPLAWPRMRLSGV